MSDLQSAKAKAVSLIKAGKLTKENAQQALAIMKALQDKGQNVPFEVILKKKGFVADAAAQPQGTSRQTKGKSTKKKKAKKVKKPEKKIIKVDEEDNKYVARRKKSNKKPALIGGILLLIILPLSYYLYQKGQTEAKEHFEKQQKKRDELEKKN